MVETAINRDIEVTGYLQEWFGSYCLRTFLRALYFGVISPASDKGAS